MEVRKLINRTVPLRVTLVLIIVLPIVGFLLAYLGGGGGSTTESIKATVNPGVITDGSSGASRMVTVVISNPHDYGVRVASISESRSDATDAGCPEGFLTTESITNPTGYIKPHGVRTYQLPVTVGNDPEQRCQGGLFTLPLTVDFESARSS